jgi:hypothetical protein
MSSELEELVSAYLSLRTERERILREYETADAELKADMTQLEAAMLATCNEIGADSIKTNEGTIMRQTKERYVCNDWDGFYKFVLDHKAPQLLEKRIHQGNFKQFYDELEGLPPGVNVMREYGITVRKPSK